MTLNDLALLAGDCSSFEEFRDKLIRKAIADMEASHALHNMPGTEHATVLPPNTYDQDTVDQLNHYLKGRK